MSVSHIALHAFLATCPQEKQRALLALMPPQEKVQPPFRDPTKGLTPLRERLLAIHASWYSTLLRSLAKNEIRLMLSILSEAQRLALVELLGFPSPPIPLTATATQFLQQELWRKLTERQAEPLPIECLPASRLNALLDCSDRDLARLIAVLGMRDVSVEIRQIIETEKLNKIYCAFSKEQMHFMQLLTLQREPVRFKRLGLAHWNGREEELQASIQQRGINRLAKALHLEHPSLLWYLSHRLDQERGALLVRLSSPLEHPQAAPVLAEQVAEALSRLSQLEIA